MHAFGLDVEGPPVAGLLRGPGPRERPVRLEVGQPAGDGLVIEGGDHGRCAVARDGRSIVATKLDPRLLFARGLPLAASLQGVVCLHASAVVVDGRAIAVCGASGAGKSTLAAALVAEGAGFLTDDVLALTPSRSPDGDGSAEREPSADAGRGAVVAHPGPAFASVGAEWSGLGRVVGESDKLHVEPPAEGMPAEVGAVFVLGAATAAPAVQLLLASAFVGRVDDAESQVALLDLCARLASTVPVERLDAAPPRELAARVLRGV